MNIHLAVVHRYSTVSAQSINHNEGLRWISIRSIRSIITFGWDYEYDINPTLGVDRLLRVDPTQTAALMTRPWRWRVGS